jgi:hypothetical protein
LTGRVMQDVRFEPLDREDAQAVARSLCEVKVRADLLDAAHRTTGGYVRNLVVALARIEQYAKARGLDAIGLADWGKRDFITGEAPKHAPQLHVVKPEGNA